MTAQLCPSFLFVWDAVLLIMYADIDVYYASFPSEPRVYKAVIYVVYILETVFTVLVTYDLGQMFIDPVAILSVFLPMLSRSMGE